MLSPTGKFQKNKSLKIETQEAPLDKAHNQTNARTEPPRNSPLTVVK